MTRQQYLYRVAIVVLLFTIGCDSPSQILDARKLTLLENSRFGSMRAQVPRGQSVELQKSDAQRFFRSLSSCELVERVNPARPSLEVYYQSGADPLVFEFYIGDEIELTSEGHRYRLVDSKEFLQWLDSLPDDFVFGFPPKKENANALK